MFVLAALRGSLTRSTTVPTQTCRATSARSCKSSRSSPPTRSACVSSTRALCPSFRPCYVRIESRLKSTEEGIIIKQKRSRDVATVPQNGIVLTTYRSFTSIQCALKMIKTYLRNIEIQTFSDNKIGSAAGHKALRNGRSDHTWI